MAFFKSLILCSIFCVGVQAGTTVGNEPKKLKVIKDNALAGGLPQAKAEIANLSDEVQKLKDALVKAGLIQAD